MTRMEDMLRGDVSATEREVTQQAEAHAEVQSHLEQLGVVIGQLESVRRAITRLAKAGDFVEATVGGRMDMRFDRAPACVSVTVATSDVIEQYRVLEAGLLREFAEHLAPLAKFAEGDRS